jgi:hypothetical protein
VCKIAIMCCIQLLAEYFPKCMGKISSTLTNLRWICKNPSVLVFDYDGVEYSESQPQRTMALCHWVEKMVSVMTETNATKLSLYLWSENERTWHLHLRAVWLTV